MSEHHRIAGVFEVRMLREADVTRAADIHIRAIPYSINALLGASHLADVYRALIRTKAAIGIVAVNDAGRIVGVVTGVLDPTHAAWSMARPAILGALPIRLLAHPKACLAILAAVFGGATRHPPGVRAALTSIAVDDAARGHGVGTRLVAALEAAFASRGIARYWLETRCNNAVARDFYAKLGFVEFSRTRRDIRFVKHIPAQEPLP